MIEPRGLMEVCAYDRGRGKMFWFLETLILYFIESYCMENFTYIYIENVTRLKHLIQTYCRIIALVRQQLFL